MRASALALLAPLLLAACSVGPVHLHRGPGANEHLEFLVQAFTADTAGREQMWQTTLKSPASDETSLQRALLRTVPGHSGYDIPAAEVELQALLARSPSAEIAPVARARLEDLRAANGCRQEVEALKRRLSQVADIEKRLDSNRK